MSKRNEVKYIIYVFILFFSTTLPVNAINPALYPIIEYLLNDDFVCLDSNDNDNDRLLNCWEDNTGTFVDAQHTGTDPNNADTDGDALKDGDEVLGTVAGLNLPALGVSPVHKNILLELDWFDDNAEPSSCGVHSHRPDSLIRDRVQATFNAAPVSNPDGTTGIDIILDYGQGGAFTGGNLIGDVDGVIAGGVSGIDFINYKSSHFATNRSGFFHYVLMPHRYNTSSGSSGQAEINGDDLIVSLYCFGNPNFTSGYFLNVANTIVHELGHNLSLRHGGNTNCNYKPNYNSVMNYKYQFPGVDTNCDTTADGVLDYSHGVRISLNENNLNENNGICNSPAIDWNNNTLFTDTGVTLNLNSADNFEMSNCGSTLTTLTDYNDWANLLYASLPAPGAGKDIQSHELSQCNNPVPAISSFKN